MIALLIGLGVMAGIALAIFGAGWLLLRLIASGDQ